MARAGLEVLAIVVGILLALAADAWWEGQQRLEREASLISALSVEFQGHQAELDWTGTSHAQLLQRAVDLLELGRLGSAPDGDLNALIRGLLDERRTDLNDGVLRGYLASADPNLITNAALRTALAEWPARLDELWQQEMRTRELADDHIAPFLDRRGDHAAILRTGREHSAERDRVVRLQSDAAAQNRNARLIDDPEFLNLVARKVRLERDALLKHAQLSEAHRLLVELLAAEADRLR